MCRGPNCGKTSLPIIERAERRAAELGDARLRVEQASCFAHCPLGPNILVERWRHGRRDERAVHDVLGGRKAGDAILVHFANLDEIDAMIDYLLSTWLAER